MPLKFLDCPVEEDLLPSNPTGNIRNRVVVKMAIVTSNIYMMIDPD